VLRTEGARVRSREPFALSTDWRRELTGVDAVVIDDVASAATALEILRNEDSPILRVLMVGEGGIRERSEGKLHELLFPHRWTRAEARVLCAWVRANTRRRAATGDA
jgi:hypothetical protein